MSEPIKAVYVLVSGNVQGVGFRYHTVAQAERLGVSGYVRNLPQGTVEVLAEGPADAVDALVAWLHEGPASAHVRDAAVQPRTPSGASGFSLRY